MEEPGTSHTQQTKIVPIARLKRSLDLAYEEYRKIKNLNEHVEEMQLKERLKLGQEPELRIKLERLNLATLVAARPRPKPRGSTVFSSGLKVALGSNRSYEKRVNKGEECKENTNVKGQSNSSHCQKDRFISSLGSFKLQQYCRKCDRVIPGPKDLYDSHLTVHKYLMPYECKIKNCVASFQHKDEWTEHRDQHRKLFPHACSECEKRFSKGDALKIHILRIHCPSPNFKYKCASCGAGFVNQSILVRHEESHSTVKPYTCELCGAKQKTKLGHSRHMEDHSDFRPFKCSACPERFTNPVSLETHYSMHHNPIKRFKCEKCGVQLRYEPSLKKHLAKQNCVEEELRVFKCQDCKKSFSNKKALQLHGRKKHGHPVKFKKKKPSEDEKINKCPECDAHFYSHRVTHHRKLAHGYIPTQYCPKKEFKCSFPGCNSAFSHSYDLKNHARRVHGTEHTKSKVNGERKQRSVAKP